TIRLCAYRSGWDGTRATSVSPCDVSVAWPAPHSHHRRRTHHGAVDTRTPCPVWPQWTAPCCSVSSPLCARWSRPHPGPAPQSYECRLHPTPGTSPAAPVDGGQRNAASTRPEEGKRHVEHRSRLE